ncbi:hypothetical protein GCM10007147_05650 [Nocardiopsis kunsanensis]|uniref:Uncharacterized protein n=1 Tax=Nocardiopsis kunsanensis TaxID=141693 RepID=A0A918X7J5_9ACTN|nr:hypothetical protein [Nocardiopsis kunsanensis]GHD16981.1 hypothetical protein GCM10007147_05650 [Nocardiopsis kunsanensis]
MTAFLLGVLSSVSATALVCAAGWVRAGRPRWWLVGLLARLTGTGISRAYREQRSAEPDLAREVARARWVKVLAGRGNTLTRDTFAPVWADGGVPVQVLLPDPDEEPGTWLERREERLARTDPGFGPGLLRSQIRTNLAYLTHLTRQNTAVALKKFDLPHIFRLVITDQGAHLTFYGEHAHGRHSPCLFLRPDGALYEAVLGLFELVWATGAPHRGAGPEQV